jgi:hypothetical protein
VLDGQLRLFAEPLEEVAPQPAGAGVREGRDDQLVDALVGDRLHHGRERVGMRDLAVDVETFAAQQRDRAEQPALGLLVAARALALRRDDQEARRALLRPFADLVEQRCAEHRLVRDHKDVGRALLRREVDDDVLERQVAGDAAHLLDGVATQPSRLLLRVRRHDHLVRLELMDRVAERRDRIRLDHDAVGGNARRA